MSHNGAHLVFVTLECLDQFQGAWIPHADGGVARAAEQIVARGGQCKYPIGVRSKNSDQTQIIGIPGLQHKFAAASKGT
jgi:hypothetical protein